MKLDGTDRWADTWAAQARRNTDDVRRFIGWGARPDAPIAPLLVVWGPLVDPPNDEFYRMENGVNVIAGKHLRQALDDLVDNRTDRDEIERAYSKLADQADRRDQSDLKREGPRRRTPREAINEAALLVSVAFVALYASTSVLRLPRWAWAPGALIILAVGIAGTRSQRLRRLALSWLAGFGVALVLALVLVVIALT